ncbi:MAG: nucleoside monophosphate kinase [Moorea sp. SIO2B7]|nr:nucleoside monophosphate kinase [Moorena sp. SIO2B7]
MLGGTGSGKGTQAQRLFQRLSIPVISTGEVLRAGIASQTSLGNQAKTYVEEGELVPDPIMIEFMKQRLLQPNVSRGWILEGYPRTAFQAEELDFLLDKLGQRFDWAIYLQVSEPIMMERSLRRSLPDDQPDIIKRRIDMFYERTVPILEYYDRRNKLLTINGEQKEEQVEEEILHEIVNM